jgi:hypothetical protein
MKKFTAKSKVVSLLFLLSIFLISCQSDDGKEEVKTLATGVFLDSAVENLSYTTDTQSGTTNSNGEFKYFDGESITFSIGDLDFPVVTAQELITPLTLANTTAVKNDAATNIARLLQTLDTDGNLSNGISISNIAAAAAKPLNFFTDTNSFENNTEVLTLITNSGSVNNSLVSKYEAQVHLTKTLNENPTSDIVGSWQISDNVIFMFLPDNRYFGITFGEENGNDGYERGTYTTEGNTVSFNTTDNNDGGALICDKGKGETCSGVSFQFALSGTSLLITPPGANAVEASPIYNGKPFSSSSIVGGWESDLNGEVMFIFLPDNRYYAIQYTEENNFTGFEKGTYSAAGETITINTLINNDGFALVCHEPAGTSCSGNIITFSVTNNIASSTQEGQMDNIFIRIY